MVKVFLDSSVLVAAAFSRTGASSYLLNLGKKRKVDLVVSRFVLDEAHNNILKKGGEKEKDSFNYLLKNANLKIISADNFFLKNLCKKIIHPKDAEVLADAILSKSDYLLSLDKKHFFTKDVKEFADKTEILLPGEFVHKWEKES